MSLEPERGPGRKGKHRTVKRTTRTSNFTMNDQNDSGAREKGRGGAKAAVSDIKGLTLGKAPNGEAQGGHRESANERENST